jgi:hypothetical protein
MEIGPVQNNQPVQQPSRQARPESSAEVVKPELTDRVEISEDARRLLAEMADRALLEEASAAAGPEAVDEAAVPKAELKSSPDQGAGKLAEIRRRVQSGYYDRPEIKREIADRLSEDLDL